MGWYFTLGSTRKDLIAELTKTWEATKDEETVKTTCLAHCYRGNIYSGVLWTVWERTFAKQGSQTRPTERWITCDLMRHQQGDGWGHKPMNEAMHPFYYSCPMKYLNMVPIEQYGGCKEWRTEVCEHHQRRKERRLVKAGDTD